MRYDQEPPALGSRHLAEQGQDYLATLGVEIAGRLVGEDHRRRTGQRPRHGDPLALTPRKIAGTKVLALAQTNSLENPVGLAAGLPAAPALQIQGVLYVLEAVNEGNKLNC